MNGPKDRWPRVVSLPGAQGGLLETPPRLHVTIYSLSKGFFPKQLISHQLWNCKNPQPPLSPKKLLFSILIFLAPVIWINIIFLYVNSFIPLWQYDWSILPLHILLLPPTVIFFSTTSVNLTIISEFFFFLKCSYEPYKWLCWTSGINIRPVRRGDHSGRTTPPFFLVHAPLLQWLYLILSHPHLCGYVALIAASEFHNWPHPPFSGAADGTEYSQTKDSVKNSGRNGLTYICS